MYLRRTSYRHPINPRRFHIARLARPLVALLLLLQTLVAPAMASGTCDRSGCGARVETTACEPGGCGDDSALASTERCADDRQCSEDDQCAEADRCGHESSGDSCADTGCARLCACCPILAPNGAQASLEEIPSVDRQFFPPAPVASPFALASSVDHPPCW